MFRKIVVRDRYAMKISLLWLVMLHLLTACMAADPTHRLPDSAAPQLKSILIVAMEAPPLEVIPDLLESRMPVYQQYDNMALPIYVDQKIYRNPGGIVIFGRVGQDDSVARGTYGCLQSFSCANGDWIPTLALSDQAASQLDSMLIKAATYRSAFPLPIVDNAFGTELDGRRKAVELWYAGSSSVVDFNRLQGDSVDAVLEIGIGRYKIFAGQLTLQLLIKLIDADTGRVIARSSTSDMTFEASTEALLAYEGAKFKAMINEMGMRLLVRGFLAMGLRPKLKLMPS